MHWRPVKYCWVLRYPRAHTVYVIFILKVFFSNFSTCYTLYNMLIIYPYVYARSWKEVAKSFMSLRLLVGIHFHCEQVYVWREKKVQQSHCALLENVKWPITKKWPQVMQSYSNTAPETCEVQ